ncbi:antiviral reverse transcriptase Drt3a [Azospirillum formosense]|uniref:antiviral reverse transcriptase Drt3a n=1 Tax=Azospirillum formosense TaxID=861533 RepID=UPI00338DF889
MATMAFDVRSIRKEVRTSDFETNTAIRNKSVLDQAVATAVDFAKNSTGTISFSSHERRGKKVFQASEFCHTLVIRKLNNNLRRITRVKQANRENIVNCLRSFLAEGVDYRVYRFDIKSFYESINRDDLLAELTSDVGFPRDSLLAIKIFFASLESQGIPGLPRGVPLSATLSEYVMRTFDRNVRSGKGIFFYARFVDDIVIITDRKETRKDFVKCIKRYLPKGLNLNQSKTRITEAQNPPIKKSATPNMVGRVEFLGYCFKIFERQKDSANRIARKVDVDIAGYKVKKIKSRIALSVLKFLKDNSFKDLEDRMKFITGSYKMYDYEKSIVRKLGLRYSYSMINISSSVAISDLDAFWRRIVLNRNGKLGKLYSSISREQRDNLLSLTFSRGFSNNIYYHFSGERMQDLVRCWNYA